MINRTEAGRQLRQVDLGYQLAAPVHQDTNATSTVHNETVPAGKFWILRNVAWSRDNAGDVNIQVINPTGAGSKIKSFSSALGGEYAPPTDFKLKAGWVVRVQFSAGTAGYMDSWILYDEGEA